MKKSYLLSKIAFIFLFLLVVEKIEAKDNTHETTVCQIDCISQNDSIVSGNKYWNVCWGIRDSFKVDIVAQWNSTKKFPGDHLGYGNELGGVMRLCAPSRWFVDVALSVAYAETKLQVCAVDPAAPIEDWPLYKYRHTSINLPVNVGYSFTVADVLQMSVLTGLKVTCTVAGSMKGPTGYPSLSLFGEDGVWRRWNLLWTFGVEFDVDNAVSVGVNGDLGLLRLARKDIFRTPIMNESSVNIGVTYWLNR